jgi:DNA-binding HxlR family transcriptional regulator
VGWPLFRTDVLQYTPITSKSQALTFIFIFYDSTIEPYGFIEYNGSMSSQPEFQPQPLAIALDIVGGRWTLLIIDELLAGPRRFTDLLASLPGISTNLLSQRLKSLEQQGIIRHRILPRPSGSAVYELTMTGEALRPAVLELENWATDFLTRS